MMYSENIPHNGNRKRKGTTDNEDMDHVKRSPEQYMQQQVIETSASATAPEPAAAATVTALVAAPEPEQAVAAPVPVIAAAAPEPELAATAPAHDPAAATAPEPAELATPTAGRLSRNMGKFMTVSLMPYKFNYCL